MNAVVPVRGLRRRAALITAVAAVLALPVAHARPPGGVTALHADDFGLAPNPGLNLLNLHTTDLLRPAWPSFAAVFGIANAPLTLAADGVAPTTVVERRMTLTLLAAVGVFERLDLGLAIPFTLASDGGDLAPLGRPGELAAGSGMGDLSVIPRLRLVDPAPGVGVGVALGLAIALPTGDEQVFDSYGQVVARPFVVVDWRSGTGGLLLTAELGYLAIPEVDAGDLTLDDAVTWGVGARVARVVGDLAVSATISGRLPVLVWSSSAAPVEADVAVELRFGSFLALAGVGAALHGDVGAPDLRVFGAFAYAPVRTDRDGDGRFDDEDGCPGLAEDLDGFEDGDGCPDLDHDADGVPDLLDGPIDGSGLGACRDVPEDVDGFEDADGCPDRDDDGDGVPDELDRCPRVPAGPGGGEDGCPAAPMAAPTAPAAP